MVMRFEFPRERKRFSSELRQRLSARQSGRCVYCGYGFGAAGKGLTVDHIVPASSGGGDEESNLQGLCRECNGWKADHSGDEFDERIGRGLTVLGIDRGALDRKTLQQVMQVTEMHENVARRRTRRFRRRIFLLFGSFCVLTVAGAWYDQSWPEELAVLDPIGYGLSRLCWVLAIAAMVRADLRGYLRWNPGRKSDHSPSKRRFISW